MTWFRNLLGGVLVFGFLATLALLFWRAIPGENEQLIVYMLGQLSGFVGGIVAYHYATTANAQQLTEQTRTAVDAVHEIAKSVPNAAAPDVVLEPGQTAQAEPRP